MVIHLLQHEISAKKSTRSMPCCCFKYVDENKYVDARARGFALWFRRAPKMQRGLPPQRCLPPRRRTPTIAKNLAMRTTSPLQKHRAIARLLPPLDDICRDLHSQCVQVLPLQETRSFWTLYTYRLRRLDMEVALPQPGPPNPTRRN
jgi:hypothetical protein